MDENGRTEENDMIERTDGAHHRQGVLDSTAELYDTIEMFTYFLKSYGRRALTEEQSTKLLTVWDGMQAYATQKAIISETGISENTVSKYRKIIIELWVIFTEDIKAENARLTNKRVLKELLVDSITIAYNDYMKEYHYFKNGGGKIVINERARMTYAHKAINENDIRVFGGGHSFMVDYYNKLWLTDRKYCKALQLDRTF